MTDLTVRRLLVDLTTPFESDWAGNAFQSALLDALSMSFPVGEQFFIDSVRGGLAALPEAQRPGFEEMVRGFIGQEATHRRLHALFNEELTRQGLVNDWAGRALKRIEGLKGVDPRHLLGITAAYEHFTALLAQWLLENHDLLDQAEPRLKTLWMWHSAEESEHRSVAFDLYQALGGDVRWRRRWMVSVTVFFLSDALRQTVSNLRRQGRMWRLSTWRAAASFLFGRRGMIRQCIGPWAHYFRRDYHPASQDDRLSRQWLSEHAQAYVPVRGA
jgi:uncharacterized protein